MKRILITGGPTNEAIDEVMKITNMSTGSLSRELSRMFYDAGCHVTFIANTLVYLKDLPSDERLNIIVVESTQDMLEAIEAESKANKYDVVIHAAAVGDYKADFSFLMEDLAQELFQLKDKFTSVDDVLKVITNPDCKLDDSSKISSYQKHLTVKLTLTPKIIARLREWFPDSFLVGCKLLENVDQGELIEVATALCDKNQMDVILANDLAKLRQGDMTRYPVSTRGDMNKPLATPEDIFNFVNERI